MNEIRDSYSNSDIVEGLVYLFYWLGGSVKRISSCFPEVQMVRNLLRQFISMKCIKISQADALTLSSILAANLLCVTGSSGI